MKRGNNPLVLCLFGILPVVWLGLLIAPAAHGGLPEILARFPAAMNAPFHIELCGDSVKTVLVLLCVYGLSIGVFLSSRRNTAGAKNTARRNGATQEPSIGNIGQ